MISKSSPAVPVEKKPSKTRRVFIVEDDPELVHLFVQILHEVDPQIEVDHSASAEVALQHLKRIDAANGSPYQLIIADIFLQGKDSGLDLWHTCKRLHRDVPVLITSGLPLEKFFSTLNVGETAPPYLEKPFNVGQGKQMIEGILDYSNPEPKKNERLRA